jgi:glutamine synthetase
LKEQREIYERHGVFPPHIIDGIIKNLQAFNDKGIREELSKDPKKMLEFVTKYYHCG